MRYFLQVAYHGKAYAGWQVQPGDDTVQARLDTALSTLLRTPISTTGAGRTDAGVHAEGNVAHFDFDGPLPKRFTYTLNCLLPYNIASPKVYVATRPDAHARYDALWRQYRYQLIRRKNPFYRETALPAYRQLDIAAMNEAAACLLNYDDFATFAKLHGANKTTFCKIHHAYWEQEGDLLSFHVRADRFLRGMVRALVGTLLEVGYGKMEISQFCAAIEAKHRAAAGNNVEPHGLFLTGVGYPDGLLTPLSLD